MIWPDCNLASWRMMVWSVEDFWNLGTRTWFLHSQQSNRVELASFSKDRVWSDCRWIWCLDGLLLLHQSANWPYFRFLLAWVSAYPCYSLCFWFCTWLMTKFGLADLGHQDFSYSSQIRSHCFTIERSLVFGLSSYSGLRYSRFASLSFDWVIQYLLGTRFWWLTSCYSELCLSA